MIYDYMIYEILGQFRLLAYNTYLRYINCINNILRFIEKYIKYFQYFLAQKIYFGAVHIHVDLSI